MMEELGDKFVLELLSCGSGLDCGQQFSPSVVRFEAGKARRDAFGWLLKGWKKSRSAPVCRKEGQELGSCTYPLERDVSKAIAVGEEKGHHQWDDYQPCVDPTAVQIQSLA